MRKLTPIYALLTALTLIVSASCNTTGSSETDPTVISANTLVSGFYIQENDSVMADLDSVAFTIDVNKRVIYNADSLPKGTDVTRLVPSITFYSSTSTGVIEISGATTMNDTTFTYSSSANDSIDFTGTVMLTVHAADGVSTKQYQLKVNVHQVESDSLYWDKIYRRALPGSLTAPERQKTVECNGTVYCLVAESGRYTMSTSTDLANNAWDKQTISLGFTPEVNSLVATSSALYILDTDGNLYKSTDGGQNWTSTGKKYYSLIGGYGTDLLAVYSDGSTYYNATLSASGEQTLTKADSQFPVSGFSQAIRYESDWATTDDVLIAGGIMANGNCTGMVWGYDGNSWASLSNHKLPNRSGITLVPYYYYQQGESVEYIKFPVLLAIGGVTADGELSKDVYISYNNGVDWKLGDDLIQLPDYISTFYGAQSVIASSTFSETRSASAWEQMPARRLPSWCRRNAATRASQAITEWECPYIYLFGGYDENSALLNNIWKGVVNRLTFKPIQ